MTVSLEPALADALRAAAAERGWSPESLVADCVRQHLEIAIRHRVLVERMEEIDATIMDMSRMIGELASSGGTLDLSGICRYSREDDRP